MKPDLRKTKTKNDYAIISSMYEDDFGKDYDHFDFIDQTLFSLEESNIKLPIVDLGSGPGVVARFLEGRGVANIISVDITPEFCQMTKTNTRYTKVICEDMVSYVDKQKDQSIGAYIANYSIIHIPDEEVDILLQNIHRSLTVNGIFMMSCHRGIFKGMEQEPYQTQNDSRLNNSEKLETYMNYFTPEELKERIHASGLIIVRLETYKTKDVPGELPVPKIWLLAKKTMS